MGEGPVSAATVRGDELQPSGQLLKELYQEEHL
jgi:hypothetical protein